MPLTAESLGFCHSRLSRTELASECHISTDFNSEYRIVNDGKDNQMLHKNSAQIQWLLLTYYTNSQRLSANMIHISNRTMETTVKCFIYYKLVI